MKPHLLVLICCILPLGMPVMADSKDHDRAMRALERGEILPLLTIIESIEKQTGGRTIEVDFDRDDGSWIYELEVITPEGRILELEVDAATGRILDQEYDD